MAKLSQGPFPRPRGPNFAYEEPDGVTIRGQNALRDTHNHPDNFNPDEDPTVHRPHYEAPKGTKTGRKSGF